MMLVPIVLLAALTVGIGLVPQPLYEVADRAAAELLDQGNYQTSAGLVGGMR
jgi:formate hydrogenlyase subunit 3/multisubunit Na+/H+ antiporter MnhD subunit